MAEVKKIAIGVNLQKEESLTLSKEIMTCLEKKGIETHTLTNPSQGIPPGTDIIITLGGDGSLLGWVEEALRTAIPLMPVNLGRYGYVTETQPDKWIETLNPFLCGEGHFSPRTLVRFWIRGQKEKVSFLALNEIVIGSGGIFRTTELELSFDGTSLVMMGDGIIIATPTGSSGHSLSAGGPLVHPEMEALIINPICPLPPFTHPIVLPRDKTIEIELHGNRNNNLLLTADGQRCFPFAIDDQVTIETSPQKLNLVVPQNKTRIAVYKNKILTGRKRG